ncbi:MAG: hypothetical protein WD181_00455, partial [Solirubrobacterales bacterium]
MMRTFRVLFLFFLPVFALTAGTSACASDPDRRPLSPDVTTASTGTESDAGASAGNLRLTTVADFNRPIEVKPAPGFPRLMFVVEQEGVIRVIRRGRKLAQP